MIAIKEMNVDKVEKALHNFKLVKQRLILKAASSPSGAQGHLGLLTKVMSDIRAMEYVLNDETSTDSSIPKTVTVDVSEDKDNKVEDVKQESTASPRRGRPAGKNKDK